MRALISFELCGVSVSIRRQQLAPKFSMDSFGGGQIHRKTQQIAETFKRTVKRIWHCYCSNSRHIQTVEFILNKFVLSKSLCGGSDPPMVQLDVWLCSEQKQNTHQVYIIWFISYFILRSDSFTRSKKNPIEFASLPTSGFVTQLVVAR